MYYWQEYEKVSDFWRLICHSSTKLSAFLTFLFRNMNHFIYYIRVAKAFGEGSDTPLQYSCLENPMDGGAWWAAVHGVAEGWTRLSDFTFTFHFPALEKEMATHSSVLAWRIPGMGEPSVLPSMGSHRVVHDWSDLAAAAAAAKALFIKILTPETMVEILINTITSKLQISLWPQRQEKRPLWKFIWCFLLLFSHSLVSNCF